MYNFDFSKLDKMKKKNQEYLMINSFSFKNKLFFYQNAQYLSKNMRN